VVIGVCASQSGSANASGSAKASGSATCAVGADNASIAKTLENVYRKKCVL